MTRMILYNLRDSELHIKVAESSGGLSEITTLTSVFKTSIQDVCRYITGTMIANMISSYALERNMVIDWSSEDDTTKRYEGALVVKPDRGLHSEVYILDIAAMYPSIMIGCNLSAETVVKASQDINDIRICDEKLGDVPLLHNSVWWNNEFAGGYGFKGLGHSIRVLSVPSFYSLFNIN